MKGRIRNGKKKLKFQIHSNRIPQMEGIKVHRLFKNSEEEYRTEMKSPEEANTALS